MSRASRLPQNDSFVKYITAKERRIAKIDNAARYPGYDFFQVAEDQISEFGIDIPKLNLPGGDVMISRMAYARRKSDGEIIYGIALEESDEAHNFTFFSIDELSSSSQKYPFTLSAGQSDDSIRNDAKKKAELKIKAGFINQQLDENPMLEGIVAQPINFGGIELPSLFIISNQYQLVNGRLTNNDGRELPLDKQEQVLDSLLAKLEARGSSQQGGRGAPPVLPQPPRLAPVAPSRLSEFDKKYEDLFVEAVGNRHKLEPFLGRAAPTYKIKDFKGVDASGQELSAQIAFQYQTGDEKVVFGEVRNDGLFYGYSSDESEFVELAKSELCARYLSNEYSLHEEYEPSQNFGGNIYVKGAGNKGYILSGNAEIFEAGPAASPLQGDAAKQALISCHDKLREMKLSQSQSSSRVAPSTRREELYCDTDHGDIISQQPSLAGSSLVRVAGAEALLELREKSPANKVSYKKILLEKGEPAVFVRFGADGSMTLGTLKDPRLDVESADPSLNGEQNFQVLKIGNPIGCAYCKSSETAISVATEDQVKALAVNAMKKFEEKSRAPAAQESSSWTRRFQSRSQQGANHRVGGHDGVPVR